jgi:LAO/AO transport system ATPase
LSRLLTLAAQGRAIHDIAIGLPPPTDAARVVAVTGSAGVGKSTLIGKLIEHVRGLGVRVAVLACDPESPLTGGALLGDRFRMPGRPDDDGLFIRSLAAASGHGAVAEHLPLMVRLFEAFGFDVVLIETVGAGQGDTAVRQLADAVVLLLQPETGDDIQWEKAGILEVADVVVIHKADLPGAEHAEAQVRAALDLAMSRSVAVVRVSSRRGAGLAALWDAVAACARRREAATEDWSELLEAAQRAVAVRFAAARANKAHELAAIQARWREGTLTAEEAGEAVLRLLATSVSL